MSKDNGTSVADKVVEIEDAAPNFYANAFETASSLSDVRLVAKTDNSPACVIRMSFTSAKTLAETLTKIVSNLEQAAGIEIGTMDSIRTAYEAFQSASQEGASK